VLPIFLNRERLEGTGSLSTELGIGIADLFPAFPMDLPNSLASFANPSAWSFIDLTLSLVVFIASISSFAWTSFLYLKYPLS